MYAIQDAIDSYTSTGFSHTVVYSNKLDTAVSMPSSTDLGDYGWYMVVTVGDELPFIPVLIGSRAG
jgi:hypothetical protein